MMEPAISTVVEINRMVEGFHGCPGDRALPVLKALRSVVAAHFGHGCADPMPRINFGALVCPLIRTADGSLAAVETGLDAMATCGIVAIEDHLPAGMKSSNGSDRPMDEDHSDLDYFDIDQLLDVLDEMFPHGHAVMPDGTPLCLCGRDLGSHEVMTETAKAAALVVEFDLVLDGCVMEAAAAYDMIHEGLKTGPARRLRQSMSNARTAVEAHVADVAAEEEPVAADGRLH